MTRAAQKEKAQLLLALHSGGSMLVLPNVWNPICARVLEKRGYPAGATASAAISASLGYQDGEKIQRSTMIDVIGRIARSVEVPVTADIEAGYGDSLSELEATTEQVIESGVVGVNIEDGLEWGGGLRPLDEQCGRIVALRRVANRRDLHLVINARVDTFVSSGFANAEQAMEDAAARASAYRAAGADCIYPIGAGDEPTVRLLRARIAAPINILVTPSAAPLAVLREIGVNRVSFGPFIFQSCLRKFMDIADDLSTTGDYTRFADMLSRADTCEFLVDGREQESPPRRN